MTAPDYGTLTEAAEIAKTSRQTVRRMIADGRLTGYRVGTRGVRVDLNEIRNLRPMNRTARALRTQNGKRNAAAGSDPAA